MKITVETKLATTISGEATYFGNSTIALDVTELSAAKAEVLFNEGATLQKYGDCWHVQIARRLIQKYELVD